MTNEENESGKSNLDSLAFSESDQRKRNDSQRKLSVNSDVKAVIVADSLKRSVGVTPVASVDSMKYVAKLK